MPGIFARSMCNAGSLVVAAVISTTAHAAVTDSAPNGFALTETVHIAAPRDKVYAALLEPSRWWSSAHSFSGNAANMTLDARAGGCWCETLPNGGSAQHLTVVNVKPGETLRLKGYLIMCRNSSRDYAEFAGMVDTVEPETAAEVLAGMDRYYCSQPPRRQWIATQLVRRLADPHPSDFTDDQWSEPDAKAEWDEVRQRCLSVAVAMLEEAR